MRVTTGGITAAEWFAPTSNRSPGPSFGVNLWVLASTAPADPSTIMAHIHHRTHLHRWSGGCVSRRCHVARCEFQLLPAARGVLDDPGSLPVCDLVLDPDHRVHRHLPQPGPVRLGQGAVVPVRAVHPADRCPGVPDRPRQQHAGAGYTAGP